MQITNQPKTNKLLSTLPVPLTYIFGSVPLLLRLRERWCRHLVLPLARCLIPNPEDEIDKVWLSTYHYGMDGTNASASQHGNGQLWNHGHVDGDTISHTNTCTQEPPLSNFVCRLKKYWYTISTRRSAHGVLRISGRLSQVYLEFWCLWALRFP